MKASRPNILPETVALEQEAIPHPAHPAIHSCTNRFFLGNTLGGIRVRFGLRRRGISIFGGEFQIKTGEIVLELRYLPRFYDRGLLALFGWRSQASATSAMLRPVCSATDFSAETSTPKFKRFRHANQFALNRPLHEAILDPQPNELCPAPKFGHTVLPGRSTMRERPRSFIDDGVLITLAASSVAAEEDRHRLGCAWKRGTVAKAEARSSGSEFTELPDDCRKI